MAELWRNHLSDSSQSEGRRSRHIEDCRGDFEEISRLIERSWAENTQQALLYPAAFLASCFEYPGASFSLAPAIYDGSTPLAFASAFPRRVCVKGRELNLVIITFLTVASELKKRGYGILLWSELVKRARVAGFDGMVNSELLTYPYRNLAGSITWDILQLRIACEDPCLENGSRLC